MIDPIILEHFRTMKERDELDAILPEILTGMGLEVLSRPTIGFRQYGADVVAVGDDEDGVRKLFLFSIKRGDLTRGGWNDSSDQALRPSLDELREVYLRTIAPEHNGLPVLIVPVVGGIVPEPVLPMINGYMNDKADGRFSYKLWTGDTLTRRLLDGVLREEIFPEAKRALLRKTAALVEEPEMALRHFDTLLNDVFNEQELEPQVRVRIMFVATRITFSWGLEADNLEVAYQGSEKLVLRAWELLHQEINDDDSRKLAASHIFFSVVQLHLDVWDAYIADKILPHAGTMHALSFAVGTVEAVDINIALFDLAGRIAAGGLLRLWMQPGSSEFPELMGLDSGPAFQIAQKLALLHSTNPTLMAPMLDRQSSDLGLALLLLCCFDETREAARHWCAQAARALILAVQFPKNGPRLPSIDGDYETLMHNERNLSEQEVLDATAATTLLPLYGMCAVILGDEVLLTEIDEFQNEKLSHSNAQGWTPNARTDAKIWRELTPQGSAWPGLAIGSAGSDLITSVKAECAGNSAWADLSCIRLGQWPLLAIACRRTATPLPPQLWMGLLPDSPVENQTSEE